eukprot:SAG22_NODE_10005_length_559_cov_0.769565_1_plen_79_part_10
MFLLAGSRNDACQRNWEDENDQEQNDLACTVGASMFDRGTIPTRHRSSKGITSYSYGANARCQWLLACSDDTHIATLSF